MVDLRSNVRPIPDTDIEAFTAIVAHAYPSTKLTSEDARQTFIQRTRDAASDTTRHLYGAYRDAHLVGCMRLFDFTMRLHGAMVPTGGVGLVGVDFLHKKEKVARDLILGFLHHYRAEGVPLAALYPFRPDFYKQMGFGYGTKMNQYRVKPSSLPRTGARDRVSFLTADDQDAFLACYNRYMAQTNGLMVRLPYELKNLFSTQENKIAAYRDSDGTVRAYIVFTFVQPRSDNFMFTHITISQIVYETSEALSGILAFLNSQSDQIREIILNTQDDSFHYLFGDPRNGTDAIFAGLYQETNTQGVGIMYRVIDVPGIFAALREHNFGDQTVQVRFRIRDSFLAENAGAYTVSFQDGRATVVDDTEGEGGTVEVEMDISDFSSVITGAVEFKRLYWLGLIRISDPQAVDTLQRIFATDLKPLCMTMF